MTSSDRKALFRHTGMLLVIFVSIQLLSGLWRAAICSDVFDQFEYEPIDLLEFGLIHPEFAQSEVSICVVGYKPTGEVAILTKQGYYIEYAKGKYARWERKVTKSFGIFFPNLVGALGMLFGAISYQRLKFFEVPEIQEENLFARKDWRLLLMVVYGGVIAFACAVAIDRSGHPIYIPY